MILINVAEPKRMGMISRYSAVILPISVGMLAGYLLSKKRKVKIIDELVDPLDDSLTSIRKLIAQNDIEKPYIFGLSCLTININRAFKIAGRIRQIYPDSVIIFGGIHPTVLPEESLNKGNADIVVRGEAEETLLLLYDAIKNGTGFSGVPGISFKEGQKIRHNPEKVLSDNLDEISFFPFELFDTAKYNLGFMITSRGCPYNCIFCSQRSISGKKCRFRSTESVIKEIDMLTRKYRQRSISFLDDNFLISKDRVKMLCGMIIKNGLNKNVTYNCQARADNVDREILSYMKEAGFISMGLGIETGSEKLMKTINKGETVARNIETVKLIQRSGLTTSGFFIFGLPSETREERLLTYLLAKQLKLKYAKFNNIVPYPGTKLYELAKSEGRLYVEGNWENFNSVGGIVEGAFSNFRPPYVPENNTARGLKKDLIRANLYFYLTSPRTLLSLFKRENTDWFSLSKKWYFSLQEYYYLFCLALKVLINALAVLSVSWLIQEARLRSSIAKLVKANEK